MKSSPAHKYKPLVELACALLAAALWPACLAFPAQHTEPVDRSDVAPEVTHIRGGVYLVEDGNYWKTNSVFFAVPEGIVFFDATYNANAAKRVLWKAATLSEGPYTGLVLTDFQLPRTGGVRAFEKERVPIYMHEATEPLLRDRWDSMQSEMRDSFASWKVGRYAGPDGLFDRKLEILGGRVRVFYPGHAHNPGNLIVHFPEEGIVYAGGLLSEPAYFLRFARRAGYPQAWKMLEALPATTYISGHGPALRSKAFLKTARLRTLSRLAERRL